jgi:hypothetical protein
MTTLVTISDAEVVVRGVGIVVNIETAHGPVAAMLPLEFMVTALTSHQ